MMTFEQIAQILETPLGGNYGQYSDVVVVRERKRVQQMYSKWKEQDIGYGEASLRARVQWMIEAQQHGQFPC